MTEESNPDRVERTGPNGEHFFGTSAEAEGYRRILEEVPELFEDDGKFIDLPQHRWMKVPLADNWADHPHKPKLAHKPYRQGAKAEAVID